MSKEKNLNHFKYFTLSAICFLVGLGTVLYIEILLPASAENEFFALLGLTLSIPSGLVAFYCYIRMLIARFNAFLEK